MGNSHSSDASALYEACLRGDVPTASTLLNSKHVDPNETKGPNEWTALHAAAYHGPASLVASLADAGAQLDAVNDQGHSPLFVALASHQFDAAEALILRGARLSGNAAPLWTKCFTISSSEPDGKPGLAKLLLSGGADPNAANTAGIPPLSEAIGMGMVDVALVILESPATNVSLPDADGITPLHYAAYAGNVELGRALLVRGADASAQIEDGSTPASFAAEEGHAAFLTMLLAAHPESLNARTKAQWSLLHVAAHAGHVAVLDTLIALGQDVGGLDVDVRNEHGTTPLAMAAAKGFVDMGAKLLKAGADPNALSDTHATPLHKAALGGHVEMVRLLIRAGADVNACNIDGWSALHVASHENHPKVASVLIEHGASLDTTSGANMTPLDVSLHVDSHTSAHVLLDHSASVANPDSLHEALAAARADNHARVSVLERAKELHDPQPSPDTEPGSPLSLARSGGRADAPMSDSQRAALLFLKAARSGSVTKMDALAESHSLEALVQARTSSGLSPLFLTISHGHDRATAWLLGRGTVLDGSLPERSVESRATAGATFLHRAILRGEDARVELLLEAYTDLNVRDGDGNTPAHVAAYMNNTAYLSLLGSSGRADLHALNHAGQTPLARSLDSPDTFRYLVLHAPDSVSVADVKGMTPIAALAQRLDRDKLHFVLAAGASPNASDTAGYTPLHHVALAAKPLHAALDVPLDVHADPAASTAELLVAHGANLDARAASDGAWPLLCAVRSQAGPLVKYLISAGASLTQTTMTGRTAYDEARSSNLAIAAMIEAGMRARSLPLPAEPPLSGPRSAEAATESIVLEWAVVKSRLSALESENARLRHEMRQLRKLVVTTARSAGPGHAPLDLDATVADLSVKGGYSRKRHRVKRRRRHRRSQAQAP